MENTQCRITYSTTRIGELQIQSRIDNYLQYVYAVDKGLRAKPPAISHDTAMYIYIVPMMTSQRVTCIYMLKSNSSDINNVAMSLYDISTTQVHCTE